MLEDQQQKKVNQRVESLRTQEIRQEIIKEWGMKKLFLFIFFLYISKRNKVSNTKVKPS